MHSIIIQGGTLVDGSGAPGRKLDLAIDGAKIGGIYDRSDGKAALTIDATGMIVCPGFIDIHSHSDIYLLGNPLAQSKIHQGVTTELVGNCGGSAAPILGSARIALKEFAQDLFVDVNWSSMDEYLLRLANLRTSVNVATLVGAETIRRSILGDADIQPSADQLDKMKRLVADSMLEGAYGLSSGLIYAPGCYAKTEELVALASVAASFGGFYASHIRGEGTTLIPAVAEAIRIGREAGIRVEISHHKACGNSNWGKVSQTIDMIKRARAVGVDVSFDVYPYTASSTTLDAIMPPWAREGGRKEVLARLMNPESRSRIAKELETKSDSWEAIASETDWDSIVLVDFKTPENKRFENTSILQIAKALGKPPVDVALDMIAQEEMRVSAIFHEMSEDDVMTVIGDPLSVIGSDGCAEAPYGPEGESATHPRAYGTFPRVLRRYVREKKVLGLEDAIRKMTSQPAERIGLADRGLLAKGMAADVVVFDPDKIADMATFEDSHRYPEGISFVLVNGSITIENGEHTTERAGQVLRHKPSIA